MTVSETSVSVESISMERVQEVLDIQRRAYIREGPPTAEVRRNRIDRFAAAILEHADELAQAMSADFGNRPAVPALSMDIAGSIPGINYVRENLETWMEDYVVPGTAEKGLPTIIQSRPKGVVGIIGTWNFPVHLVVEPAIEALAAGNRVMIKFSKTTPRTGAVVAKALAARFSPEEVFVVYGGQVSGSAFSKLKFDHLFFTGSPEVGAAVATQAAKNLVPVTLELGGKNPVVVGEDADIAMAAERVAAQRMMNGGQLCLCPDYVFVPKAKRDAFVSEYRKAIAKFFPNYLQNPDVITEIDEGNYVRVVGLIEDARKKGAAIVYCVPENELSLLPDPKTRRIPPTLVLGVTEDMTIAREEVFGPVLSVFTYEKVEEAFDYLNGKPHPLASYWYGDDTPDFREFCRRTNSGGTTRNDMALHFTIDGAPFGGVGKSGIGAYHGKAGFDELSHQRTITQSHLPLGIAPSSMPPYTQARLDQTRQGIAAQLAIHLRNLGEVPKA